MIRNIEAPVLAFGTIPDFDLFTIFGVVLRQPLGKHPYIKAAADKQKQICTEKFHGSDYTQLRK